MPIFSVIGAKIFIDFALHLSTVHLYRRWTGDTAALNLWMVIVTAVVEPFMFQLPRDTGAAAGLGGFSWPFARVVRADRSGSGRSG